MNHYDYLNRKKSLFHKDIEFYSKSLFDIVSSSRFLVLGGAGTIGQAVVKEIFKRKALKLHVVDISENNLVELVRDIRSSLGYLCKDFKTFAIDINSIEYDAFINQDGLYDYVLNLSALKHVRSESDPYTLMRMIQTNIINTHKTLNQSISKGVKKYFCVSTDKASNPVNIMGASKKIMEFLVINNSDMIEVSSARFANVLFSDGSLPFSFTKRFEKKQPISVPNDIKRYFISSEESGQLCLMSCIYGKNNNIFFPKLNYEKEERSFINIAEKFLQKKGYKTKVSFSEDDARSSNLNVSNQNYWPCYFSSSETTGEKIIEEFYEEGEQVNMNLFNSIGVIKKYSNIDMQNKIGYFIDKIQELRTYKSWTKNQIVKLFNEVLPEFNHVEKGRFLDDKM